MQKPNRYLLKKLIERGEKAVDRLEDLILPKPWGRHITEGIFWLIVVTMISTVIVFSTWMVVTQPRSSRMKRGSTTLEVTL